MSLVQVMFLTDKCVHYRRYEDSLQLSRAIRTAACTANEKRRWAIKSFACEMVGLGFVGKIGCEHVFGYGTIRILFECSVLLYTVKVKKVKERIAVNGFPSRRYGTSITIWDHKVLPATRHK